MKKITTPAAVALCTITLCLASCSKGDNNENIGDKEKELTKEQFLEARTKVLNSIPGSYKGLISADAKNQGFSDNIRWNINKNGIAACKNFPYEALALGISTDDNSSEAAYPRSTLKEVPLANLQSHLIGNPDPKDPADLYAASRITTKVQTSQGTYSVVGQLRNDRLNAHYDIKLSSLSMKFIIYRLDKVIEHQDGHIEYKQEKRSNIPIESELRTTEEKEM